MPSGTMALAKILTSLPIYLLFLLMLFVPAVDNYKIVKAILLIISLYVIIVLTISERLPKMRIHSTVLMWSLFYLIIGSFYMLIGVINDTPGALRVGTVYFVWPLIFTLLISGVRNEKVLINLTRCIIIGSICVGLFGISIILYHIGILPELLYFDIFETQYFVIYADNLVINFKGINTLFFTVPFIIAALLTWKRCDDIPISHSWLWVGFFLGVLLVILSNRDVLMLVVLLSPPVTLFFGLFRDRYHRKLIRKSLMKFCIVSVISTIGILSFLSVKYEFNVYGAVERVLYGFDFTNNPSAIIRTEQLYSLIEGISEHAVIGAGHGASVDYVRSKKHSWGYELSYVALAYQVGVVGLVAYCSGVLWIYFMVIRILKKDDRLAIYMLPVAVGMTCFLLGNATNPYLATFDFIWVIFLPIGIINYWLICKKSRGNSFLRRSTFSSEVSSV